MIYWFNEGKQANEYRARKADQMLSDAEKNAEKKLNRYAPVIKDDIVSKYYTPVDKDGNIKGKTTKSINRDGSIKIHGNLPGDHNGKVKKAKNNDGTQGTVYFPDDKDDERSKNASNFTKRVHSNSGNGFFDKLEKMGTYDAVNRNMRRHPERWDGDKPAKPKTESTIFDNIEII